MHSRVVFFHSSSYGIGGIEKWIILLGGELLNRGHDVEYLSLRPTTRPLSADESPIPARVLTGDLHSISRPTSTVQTPPLRRRLKARFPHLASALMRLPIPFRPAPKCNGPEWDCFVKYADRLDPETVVIATSPETALFAAEYLKNRRNAFRLVIAFHNTTRLLNDYLLRKIIKNANQQAELFVALTEEDAFYAQHIGAAERVHAIANPAPTQIDYIPILDRPKKVVMLGRLDYEKGHIDALKAWSHVTTKFPDWHFEIYGSGNYENKIKKVIKKLNLENSVSLRGTTAQPLETFSAVRVHLFPSRFEGWPLIIGEANAAGTPTLGYDCAAGVRMQVIDGVNGHLYRTGDYEGLATQLDAYLSNPDLLKALSQNARTQNQAFTLSNIASQWEAVIKAETSK